MIALMCAGHSQAGMLLLLESTVVDHLLDLLRQEIQMKGDAAISDGQNTMEVSLRPFNDKQYNQDLEARMSSGSMLSLHACLTGVGCIFRYRLMTWRVLF